MCSGMELLPLNAKCCHNLNVYKLYSLIFLSLSWTWFVHFVQPGVVSGIVDILLAVLGWQMH